MNYSTLIKALRESMILSQKEFAKYLGVSLPQLIDGRKDITNLLTQLFLSFGRVKHIR